MDQPKAETKPLHPAQLSMIAVLVGVIGGFGAVAFRMLIAFVHNLFFLGKLSIYYEANYHAAPSPWGPLIIFVPVAGAAGVSFLITRFAPEAKGHGVPEVMEAIYYKRGIIRPIVAVVKSLASALSIGSGGSVGREGPMIQIGSSFGSTLGQYIKMPAWQRITLVSAGTGAGIAATFNTPIGGLLFAIEIMLHEVSVRTLVPVVLATATATYIGQVFFGVNPAFLIPGFQTPFFELSDPVVLVCYFGLGMVTGVCSAMYIHAIYFMEDLFDRKVPGNYYLRHMTGMFLVGVLMYVSLVSMGHYYVEGVGYSTIQDILTGGLASFWVMVLLFVLKLLATSITLGSGASGGIFSPAFFLGATAGGAYGILLKTLFPSLSIDPALFALAGMAGVVCGSTGAAVTALIMVFEMTLDYSAILPLTVTVAASNGIRALISKETIYTLKLARRGHFIPNALQTNFLYVRRAKYIMAAPPAILPASMPLADFARLVTKADAVSPYLVEDKKQIVGMVSRDVALKAFDHPDDATIADFAQRNFILVTEDTPFFEVVNWMRTEGAAAAVVIAQSQPYSMENVLGIIAKEQIAAVMEQGVGFYQE